MSIETDLYKAAVKLAEFRYPQGWGGAAAIRTITGKILTSVSPEVENASLNLCMEVGAYLEAHKLNEKVTHTLCVSRDSEDQIFKLLTPCGICQERLRYWGSDVKAAVTNKENRLLFKALRELQPYHWSEAYGDGL